MLRISPNIALNDDEIVIRFVRSSGPGGQNVNKLATAAQLRFNVLESPSLPERVKFRLAQQNHNKINSEGELIIDARRFRTQERNRNDAIDRLCDLIRHAAIEPKKRVKTKPSRAAKKRVVESKRRRGDVKRSRSTNRKPDLE